MTERFQRWFAQGADAVRQAGRVIDEIKQTASDVVEHIIMLIAVFLLQTLVIPLFLLWALLRVAGLLGFLAGARKAS